MLSADCGHGRGGFTNRSLRRAPCLQSLSLSMAGCGRSLVRSTCFTSCILLARAAAEEVAKTLEGLEEAISKEEDMCEQLEVDNFVLEKVVAVREEFIAAVQHLQQVGFPEPGHRSTLLSAGL